MKFARTLALIASSTLLLSACGQDSEDAVTAVSANSNPLLAHAPADTAYVFAALEPIPEEITAEYVARFQPVLDVLTEKVAEFKAEYDSGNHEGEEMADLATAILEELGGNLTPEGLANLGINLQADHAFYAMGVFPVMRVGLEDASKLRAAIARIETKMGFTIPIEEFNGNSYWRAADDGSPVGVYIAILDQQLAISMFPTSAEDKLLASFLGQEMPAQSMASSNALAIMNSQKGYTGYGSGMIDFQSLANEMLDINSATHSYLGADLPFDVSSLDAVCVAEVRAMLAKAPRVTAGTTKITADEIGFRTEVEIEGILASSLAALVSDTPAATESSSLLSASIALQIGKARTFLLEKADAISASPYQCSELQELNQTAIQLANQLNIPMPPMVNNLMGLRVQMDDLELTSGTPQGSGLLALHVAKPEMFVGMASMMVPGFEELDLPNQSEPVKIPSQMTQMNDLDIWALMGDGAIGVSLGEDNAKDLGAFLNTKSANDGTFFSLSYDIARQMDIEAAFMDNMDYANDTEHDEFSKAVRETYGAILDRSRVDVRMTGNALTIDSSMTFK